MRARGAGVRSVMRMDRETLRAFAREVLHLELTDADAAAVSDGIERLRTYVGAIEAVPLGYLEDPPVTPRDGDAWLDTWPADDV
jgi:hypothetical protein